MPPRGPAAALSASFPSCVQPRRRGVLVELRPAVPTSTALLVELAGSDLPPPLVAGRGSPALRNRR
eukprot:9502037-Pyramimonas_sp.AAC.1